MKKYNAWKAKSNGDYIEGTDRLLSGKSKRSILSHLSYEEGVEYKHDIMIVRCKDGTIWCFQEV
jgi:hypothetical protein